MPRLGKEVLEYAQRFSVAQRILKSEPIENMSLLQERLELTNLMIRSSFRMNKFISRLKRSVLGSLFRME